MLLLWISSIRNTKTTSSWDGRLFEFMFQWHELVLITFEIRISLLYLHVHKQCNPIPCLSYTQKLFPNNYACIETMQNRCSPKKIIFPRLLCPAISIETINDAWFFWFHGRFFFFRFGFLKMVATHKYKVLVLNLRM